MRERKRVLRQRLANVTEAVTVAIDSDHALDSRRLSFFIDDYGDDDWTTDDAEDDDIENQQVEESATLRESRLRVMKSLPKCFDEDMAQRCKILKQVKLL